MAKYTVTSCNFSFHAAVLAASYGEAMTVAKARGFEARIECDGALVAVWSPLYGTKIYSRSLAV